MCYNPGKPNSFMARKLETMIPTGGNPAAYNQNSFQPI